VRYLLRNGATFSGEIWHADVCRWCVTLALGLLSTEVIVVKKINILFKFLNVNKLAINSYGLWMVGWLSAQQMMLGREHGAAGLRNFTYSNPLCGQSPDGVCSAIGMGHSSQNRA